MDFKKIFQKIYDTAMLHFFLRKRIQYFCYTFIAGVGFSAVFLDNFPSYSNVTYLGLTFKPIYAMLGASVLLLILSYFARKNKTLFFTFFILAPFIGGIYSYQRVQDTSGEFHLSSRDEKGNFKYLDKNFFDKTRIIGTVVRDPDSRAYTTHVDIQPEEIILNPEDPKSQPVKVHGKTGYVRAFFKPSIGQYYDEVEYGDRVQIEGSLSEARRCTNPAGFDYCIYLRNRNVYATMYVASSQQIKYLGVGKVNALVRFSLRLKQKLLLSIRKTMPYPESGFLGGVTLGLRSGVHPQVKYEFQSTGVAHVLAVSGLHVGFVAFLFVMVTSILKIPAKRATPLIVLGLIVFTIITGASPATRRAALMFSMYFIFREFGLGGMRSSRLTIPVSAFILMTYDPLKIFDASFVMSYMAVWALAYVSWPVGTKIFSKFMVGIPFILNLFWITVATFVVSQHPTLYRETTFLYPFLSAFFVSNAAAYWLQKKTLWAGASYNDLPRYFVRFTWAQLGIQIGMMYPLSAQYFNRFPVSGVFANFIAIPLIGVIVQLGLISSAVNVFFNSIGLTQIGMNLALLINAGNYIAAKFFMDMSHFFSIHFPYPYMQAPTTAQFVLYFIAVSIFVWWDNIRLKAMEIYWQLKFLVQKQSELRKSKK